MNPLSFAADHGCGADSNDDGTGRTSPELSTLLPGDAAGFLELSRRLCGAIAVPTPQFPDRNRRPSILKFSVDKIIDRFGAEMKTAARCSRAAVRSKLTGLSCR
jgi:hypothetical protein